MVGALWTSEKDSSHHREWEQSVQRLWGRNMPRGFEEEQRGRGEASNGQVERDVVREQRGGPIL